MTRSQWIQVAALAVLFFCALAYLATPLLPKSETSAMKVIELVIAASASIGTAFAAVVALHFGLASQRAQQQKDRAVAEIVAVKLAVKLTPIMAALRVDPVLRQKDSSQTWQFRCCQICSGSIASHWFPADQADLIALVPLGRRLPQKLAFIFEKLKTLPDDVDRDELWITRSEQSKEESLDVWLNTINLCRLELDKLSKMLHDVGIKELDSTP